MVRKMAGFFRSASGFMNILVAALKTIGEHYPGRLHKAFVIDPPSLFPYLWKVINHNVTLLNGPQLLFMIFFKQLT